MQVKKFENGGFVLHKVTLPCSTLTFSAWFDERGQLLDVDAFTASGRRHGAFSAITAKGQVGQELKLLGFRTAAAIFPNPA